MPPRNCDLCENGSCEHKGKRMTMTDCRKYVGPEYPALDTLYEEDEMVEAAMNAGEYEEEAELQGLYEAGEQQAANLEEDARSEHVLVIVSLHDAAAKCSCGHWFYSYTGARTRGQVREEWAKHIEWCRRSKLLARESTYGALGKGSQKP